MIAAAYAQGDIAAFVGISEYEQSFMTLEKMTAPLEERRALLGGLVMEWSGLPTVNIRGAVFVENPLPTWLALEPLSKGEPRLPFGEHRLAPVAGYDVAEDFAAVLGHPVAYVPEDVETWNAAFVDGSLGELPHTAQHMKTLTRLICAVGAGEPPAQPGVGGCAEPARASAEASPATASTPIRVSAPPASRAPCPASG